MDLMYFCLDLKTAWKLSDLASDGDLLAI